MSKVRILKIDKQKRIVFGPVLIPNVPDLQGDIITEEDIENAAHRYMIESRVTGFRHETELDAAIVESFIVKSDSWFGNKSGSDGEYIPKGAWLVGMKIFNEQVWQGVLEGKYNSFSIGGFGERQDIDPAVMEGAGEGGGN